MYQSPLLEERVARRAGCGVAAKGGVIDGCCAAYTTSVTPVGVPASPQGEALGAAAPVRVNIILYNYISFCGYRQDVLTVFQFCDILLQ